jgi:hypothetical protein
MSSAPTAVKRGNAKYGPRMRGILRTLGVLDLPGRTGVLPVDHSSPRWAQVDSRLLQVTPGANSGLSGAMFQIRTYPLFLTLDTYMSAIRSERRLLITESI